MLKVTKIVLATSLILSLGSIAMAEDGVSTDTSSVSKIQSDSDGSTSTNISNDDAKKDTKAKKAKVSKFSLTPSGANDISGLKALVGVGIGTDIRAEKNANGVTLNTPKAGFDARLKLGGAVFKTLDSSTIGLQATLGIGANVSRSFVPQYSLNLDFIQAFNVGNTGYIKIGYIAGVGAAIRTNDNVNSGSGSVSNNTSLAALTAAQLQSATKAFDAATTEANNQTTKANYANGRVSLLTDQTGLQTNIDAFKSTKPADLIKDLIITPNPSKNIKSVYIGEVLDEKGKPLTTDQALALSKENIANQNGGKTPVTFFAKLDQSVLDGLKSTSTSLNDEAQRIVDGVNATRGTSNSFDTSKISDIKSLQTSAQSAIDTYNAVIKAEASKLTELQGAADTALKDLGYYNSVIQNLQDLVVPIKMVVKSTDAKIENPKAELLGVIDTNNALVTQALAKVTAAEKSAQDLSTKATAAKSDLDKINAAATTLKATLQGIAAAQTALAASAQNNLEEAKKAKDEAQKLALAANNTKKEASQPKSSTATTILPTAKLGVIAFIGTRQSVSLEYQHYFGFASQNNFSSNEITLNYAYYFGGK
ncbi:hypothetical protein [Helicobacter sp. 11S02629-2]|uniref:hypothetical protein n=1 Tax=Helicobacter sp. 11S02629-2 TaxID=1476195 RepID=UPI000BA52693|nr:hypothetical protein [Helicobacter sp. 11S02629-2]PAF44360.1 hypothetical protein BKH40_05545 [Helicobacter sp. 11S02629-2]